MCLGDLPDELDVAGVEVRGDEDLARARAVAHVEPVGVLLQAAGNRGGLFWGVGGGGLLHYYNKHASPEEMAGRVKVKMGIEEQSFIKKKDFEVIEGFIKKMETTNIIWLPTIYN